MQWYEAIILGLVEGLTEYLPISSTGHLIIASAFLGLDSPPDVKRSVDAFNIIVQGGAILAVVGLYRTRVWQMIRGMLGRQDEPAQKGRKLAINLIVAFLPAAVLGVAFNDIITHYLFRPLPVILALALGGIALILLSGWQKRYYHDANDTSEGGKTFIDLDELTWKHALAIGLAQCVAMWPGTSRSMMTIMGGMVAGLRPKQAAEFSFLLGLPTLGGACVYKASTELLGDTGVLQSLGWMPVLLGIVVATLSAALAIKWLVGYLSKHGLSVFGWYRLALCAVLSVFVMRGVLVISPDDEAAISDPSTDSRLIDGGEITVTD